jgi:DNA-binding transcriptional LysR family regulator
VQIKWLEDFLMLAQTRSFTRSAELRHVTHPAFGRRIKALETWAGTPLIDRDSHPLELTVAGQALVDAAESTMHGLQGIRESLQLAAGREARTVVLATGRTLARTHVPDWLVRLTHVFHDAELRIRTGSLSRTVQMLEHGESDFALVFHHTALSTKLNARNFMHMTVGTDKLVPVSRADLNGKPIHALSTTAAVPYLAYDTTLAMGHLVEDHLTNLPSRPLLQRVVECDSADAQFEYVARGIGVAWIPWSLAHPECKAKRFAQAGERRLEIKLELRLYRPKRTLSPKAEAMWRALGG